MSAQITASLDAMRAAFTATQEVSVDGVPHLIVPAGATVHSMESLLARPRRTQRVVTANAVSGFVDYVNKFKSPATQLYAEHPDKAALVARIDDHMPGEPAHVSHTCIFPCPRTKEWQTWLAKDRSSGAGPANKVMTQIEFAEFIEANIRDIASPSGASLLEAVLKFEATTTAHFRSAARLSSGHVQFHYVEDDGQKVGEITFPERMTLGLQVFEGQSARYPLELRLRRRLDREALTFWFELDRPDLVLKQAYADLQQSVTEQTGLSVIKAL